MSRLESFSDAVIAVAITLLVLNIEVPPPGSGRLGSELLHQWPAYAAYATSFLTIGIIWINHHWMLAIAAAIAAVSAYATLAICAGIAVFYSLPIASGGEDPS